MVQLLADVDRMAPGDDLEKDDLEKALKEVDELIELMEFCGLSSERHWICRGKLILHPQLNKRLLERHPLLRDLSLCSEVLTAAGVQYCGGRIIHLERNLLDLKGLLQLRTQIFDILAEDLQKEDTPISSEQLKMLGRIKRSRCPTIWQC